VSPGKRASRPARSKSAGLDPGPLVSVDWVAEQLGDADLRIVHVAPDRRVYNKRHLPGAVLSDLHRELALKGTAPETRDAEREWLVPTREQAEQVLGAHPKFVLSDGTILPSDSGRRSSQSEVRRTRYKPYFLLTSSDVPEARNGP